MPRSANYWDCASLEELGRSRSLRMFGNAHIGDLNQTNLQCAGQLGYGDEPTIITNWYARTDFVPGAWGDFRATFDRFAQNTVCTFQVGDRIVWRARLDDLFREPQFPSQPRWPEIVPKRQHVGVHMDCFASRISYGDLDALSQAESVCHARIWIHLEGLRLLNNESDPVDNADEILALLTRVKKVPTTTEERIVEWLSGMLKEEQDPAGAAQLHAIVDGILEGRHRK